MGWGAPQWVISSSDSPSSATSWFGPCRRIPCRFPEIENHQIRIAGDDHLGKLQGLGTFVDREILGFSARQFLQLGAQALVLRPECFRFLPE